jgi:hypothetical protein
MPWSVTIELMGWPLDNEKSHSYRRFIATDDSGHALRFPNALNLSNGCVDQPAMGSPGRDTNGQQQWVIAHAEITTDNPVAFGVASHNLIQRDVSALGKFLKPGSHASHQLFIGAASRHCQWQPVNRGYHSPTELPLLY